MKFLVLKTKKPRPGQPRFRVFLADGTELTDAIRIAISGGVAQHTVTMHSIVAPSPDRLHFEVDRLELEFVAPEVDFITEAPTSLYRRVAALVSKWNKGMTFKIGDLKAEGAAHQLCECAEQLDALLGEVVP